MENTKLKEHKRIIDHKRLLNSFGYASSGIKIILRREQNIKIQLVIAIFVIILGFFLNLEITKFTILLIMIAQVLSLETFNSALEIYIDKAHPENNNIIGIVKDILSAGVLISVIFSIAIGLIVFYEPISALILK